MQDLLLAIAAFLFGFFAKSLYDQSYLIATKKVLANIPEETPPPIPESSIPTLEEIEGRLNE